MWHGELRQKPKPIEKCILGRRVLKIAVLACLLVAFALLVREQYARYMLDRNSAYRLAEEIKINVCEEGCGVFESIVESDINNEKQKHYEFFWCGVSGSKDLLVIIWDNGLFIDYSYWWVDARNC